MNRTEKTRKIVELFAGMDYGESLTHGQIADYLGIKKTDKEYRYLVSQAQKQLIEHGKMVECVRGIGYRLVAPDDYTLASTKCVATGVKRINKGAKILANAPVHSMTQEGVQAYNSVRDRMVILQAAVSGARVEINMLAKKRPHPLSVTK